MALSHGQDELEHHEGEMTAPTPRTTVWSERVWPLARVLFVQLLLATGLVGNIAGWLVLALLVDRLHWLAIDFHGKTLETIAPEGKILGLCVLFVVNLLLVVGAWRLLERRRLAALFWRFARGEWRPLGWGLLAGAGEVALVFGSMTALGVAHSRWGLTAVPAGRLAVALGWLLASCVLAPLVEELLNRGYWLQNLARGWGIPAAAVVSSLLFGGLHLFNPHATLLGALNIALSGLAFVLGLVWLRSLWFAIGWHAAWNFAQFFLVGLPNSGISATSLGLDGTTLLTTTVAGPNWLSGGEFGLEASVIDTAVLLGMLAVMWRLKRSRTRGGTDGSEVAASSH